MGIPLFRLPRVCCQFVELIGIIFWEEFTPEKLQKVFTGLSANYILLIAYCASRFNR